MIAKKESFMNILESLEVVTDNANGGGDKTKTEVRIQSLCQQINQEAHNPRRRRHQA